jgi:protein tyrosine phosphatase (PTP) superfamily phosphohydrolase (DUF442 family)
VFFNQEYIGDCCCTVSLCKDSASDCIFKKLKTIALGKKMTPPFPPPAEASIVKVTDDIACSAQPTQEQLQRLSQFGIRSVLNLLQTNEASFWKGEEDSLKQQQSKEAGAQEINYIHHPLVDVSVKSLSMLAQLIDSIKQKPILIHCDTGQRAGLVALICALNGEQTKITEEEFIQMGKENLQVNLKPFAKVAIQFLQPQQHTEATDSFPKKVKVDEQ